MNREAMKSSAEAFRKRKLRQFPKRQQLILEESKEKSTMANQEKYKFHINTPTGPAAFEVPAKGMKVCPCGCDLFRLAYRIAYARPTGVLGAEPMCLRVEAYLCLVCDRELSPSDATHADVEERSQKENGKLVETPA